MKNFTSFELLRNMAVDQRFYWFFFVIGLAWMIVLWSQSPGWYFLDEIEHVNLNRTAWLNYEYIWDFWGRTGYTLMYMFPSLFGLNGARFLSVLLAASIVLITTGVAHKLDVKRLYLIPLFLWFQPWYVDMMYAANTMIPLSFCMILGVYLWLDDRPLWASVVFGSLGLMRNEAIFLTGLWGLYVLYKRNWWAAIITVLPVISHNLSYLFLVRLDLASMPIAHYLIPRERGLYGYGNAIYFLNYILWAVQIPILFWWVQGLLKTHWRQKEGLIQVFYWSFVALHTIIFMYGLFASGGYGFFVLPVAPILAITAARGANFMIDMVSKGWPLRSMNSAQYGLLALIAIPVMIPAFLVVPRPLSEDALALGEAVDWVHQHSIEPNRIVTAHPYVFYLLFFGTNTDLAPQQGQQSPDTFPEGTVLIWDDHMAEWLEWKFSILSESDNDWVELARFGQNDSVVIFARKS